MKQKYQKILCPECEKYVEIILKNENMEVIIEGENISYIATKPICQNCGTELYIRDIDELNIKESKDKYREKIGIIRVSEINQLLKKYMINEKTLAKLIDNSEVIISSYLNGAMPTEEYSDKLKGLQNPYRVKELLDSDKKIITGVSRKKLEDRLIELIQD